MNALLASPALIRSYRGKTMHHPTSDGKSRLETSIRSPASPDETAALIVVPALLRIPIPARADEFTDTIDIYRKSPIVDPSFKSAYGYAVFPTIGKADYIVDDVCGNGHVYHGGKVTANGVRVRGLPRRASGAICPGA